MSNYIQFSTEDGEVFLVEVDSISPIDQNITEDTEKPSEVDASLGKVKEKLAVRIADSQDTFEDALNVIKSNANAFIRTIKELPDKPDELQLSFGLKAMGELGGTFVVAKAGIEAGYTVTLTWKNAHRNRDKLNDAGS